MEVGGKEREEKKGGLFFFFSSRRRHTRLVSDWSSDVCSSDLVAVTFCNDAKSLIESTGLGVEQFNRMVEIQLIDPNLSQRVQEELVRLQRPQ